MSAARTEGQQAGGWSRLRVTVEPVLFLVSFIRTLSDGVTINLLEANVCVHHFNNSTLIDCINHVSPETKTSIQYKTSQVNMINNMVQAFFPVFLALFIGPWSDRNGRRPFLLSALVGFMACYMCWGVLSLLGPMKLIYFVIPAVPLSLSGGIIALIICCFSYICDAFTPEHRTIRFNISVSCLHLGSLLASAVASPMFNASGCYGFQVLFFSCSALALLALLYAFFLMPEILVKSQDQNKWLFDLSLVKSVLVVILCRRRSEMVKILLTVTILLTDIVLTSGESGIMYLVGKSQYSWSYGTFNLFAVTVTIVSVISPTLGIWVCKKHLKLDNFIIICIFSIMMIASELVRAFSWSELAFWISSGLVYLNALIGPTIGSELSNIVPKEDLGKVYAFSSMLDALSPFASVVMYSSLYRLLLPERTLFVYLLSSTLAALIAAASFAVYKREHMWSQKITFQ